MPKRRMATSPIRGPQRKAALFEPKLDFLDGRGPDSKLCFEFVARISCGDLGEALRTLSDRPTADRRAAAMKEHIDGPAAEAATWRLEIAHSQRDNFRSRTKFLNEPLIPQPMSAPEQRGGVKPPSA
jgi:hypothetical protein